MAKITARTLALAGGHSPAWAQRGAQTIAASIPGAEQQVLQGQGHGAADDVLIPVLTAFFT